MDSIKEVKDFFNRFECIPLHALENATSEISTFSSNIRGNSLEGYLKEEAINDDQAGKTCVYIIKEPENGKIVCFFSIKCGSVYDTHEEDDIYRTLDTKELQLLQILEDVRRDDFTAYPAMCQKYRVDYSKDGLGEKLISVVEYRADRKKDKTGASCINVENAHPAIEIQHFCRCDDYIMPRELQDLDFPLGFGLFWQQIIPKIKEVSSLIGCEYLYLFAADKSEDDRYHLVNHYKDAMGFVLADDLGVTLARPDDDNKCHSLVQKIEFLDDSCQTAWHARSDIMSEWE